MVEIKICVGGSCHLRGAREIIEELNRLIIKNEVIEKVHMEARSCMGECLNGVCMEMDGEKYTNMTAEAVRELFEDRIMPICYSRST